MEILLLGDDIEKVFIVSCLDRNVLLLWCVPPLFSNPVTDCFGVWSGKAAEAFLQPPALTGKECCYCCKPEARPKRLAWQRSRYRYWQFNSMLTYTLLTLLCTTSLNFQELCWINCHTQWPKLLPWRCVFNAEEAFSARRACRDCLCFLQHFSGSDLMWCCSHWQFSSFPCIVVGIHMCIGLGLSVVRVALFSLGSCGFFNCYLGHWTRPPTVHKWNVNTKPSAGVPSQGW